MEIEEIKRRDEKRGIVRQEGDSIRLNDSDEEDGHHEHHADPTHFGEEEKAEDSYLSWDEKELANYVLKHLEKEKSTSEHKKLVELFKKEGVNGARLKDMPIEQWKRIVEKIELLVQLPNCETMRGEKHPKIATLVDVPSKLADVKTGIWFAAMKFFNRKPRYDAYYPENEMFCHNRGGYPYFAPRGWRRYGFYPKKESETEEDIERIMKTWHVAYHGTKKINVDSILTHGLVPPGSKVDGKEIKNMNGRAGAKDSIPIYVSPSIEYAAHWLYTSPYKASDNSYVYCVFQVRVKPNSFTVQHNTLWEEGWKDNTVYYDETFHSNDLEWLITNPDCIRVTGLMVKKDKTDPKEKVEQKFAEHQRSLSDEKREKNTTAQWWWNAEPTGGNVLALDKTFKKYEENINRTIERAWVHHQKYVFIGDQATSIGLNAFYIDFAKMEQTRCDNPKLRRKVKREVTNPASPGGLLKGLASSIFGTKTY